MASCCFALGDMPRAFARFSIIFCACGVRLGQNLRIPLFRFRELLLDLLGVQQALGDPLPPFLEHA